MSHRVALDGFRTAPTASEPRPLRPELEEASDPERVRKVGEKIIDRSSD